MNKYFAISLLLWLGSGALSAQVKLSPIFSNNMVLQQQTQAPIWGESKPNKKVEVTTSWNQKKYIAQADAQGKWKTKVETYNGKVYDGYMYTDNGLWDTFRSQFPLTNILHPTMQGNYMNALLAAQEQCGWLPSWSAPGDEDQGGMSSWYILSSLGIYSVCPGTDEYVIGSPLFKKATITLENGNKFTIEANNNGAGNVYIQSATLNGRLLEKNFIRYDDIAEGGVMKFEMGDQPNKERGTTKYAAPFSLSKK